MENLIHQKKIENNNKNPNKVYFILKIKIVLMITAIKQLCQNPRVWGSIAQVIFNFINNWHSHKISLDILMKYPSAFFSLET